MKSSKKRKGGKKRNALFVGRFQPFHNGHLNVIKEILKRSEKITIVIGGPEKRDERNPFSFRDRELMIRLALHGEGISGKHYKIFKVFDVNGDDEWNVKIKKLGTFDVAYSRNPWVRRCLKKIGIPVRKHAFYERYKNCGRVVRSRISEGKAWKGLVPIAVYKFILKLKSAERKIRS
jgi:nicotinamide-nucleotide adenylyltransferase